MAGLERLHPFDAYKYGKMMDLLLAGDIVTPNDVIPPDILTEEDYLCVHPPSYISTWTDPEVLAEIFEVDYLRNVTGKQARERFLPPFSLMAGGTLRAAREALRCGTAFNIGGGFHHAHADHGSGFCLIADTAVAIRVLLRDGLISRAAIIDCDVHQGDGNAAIFAHDDNVYTLSFHQEDLFPFEKQVSNRDVPFAAGIRDGDYIALVHEHAPQALDDHKPDIVFYVGGSDVHRHDQLGGALLSTEGIIERDEFVWSEARRREIPFVMVLAGGYFPDCPNVHAESIGNICRLVRQRG
jgi:histone deacetylase 11